MGQVQMVQQLGPLQHGTGSLEVCKTPKQEGLVEASRQKWIKQFLTCFYTGHCPIGTSSLGSERATIIDVDTAS